MVGPLRGGGGVNPWTTKQRNKIDEKNMNHQRRIQGGGECHLATPWVKSYNIYLHKIDKLKSKIC